MLRAISFVALLAVVASAGLTPKWQTTLPTLVSPNTVFTCGSTVFGLGQYNEIFAVDMNSGALKWLNNVTGGQVGFIGATPDCKSVAFASNMGNFSVVDATTGATAWSLTALVPTQPTALVVTTRNLIVMTATGMIVSYGLEGGFVSWQSPANGLLPAGSDDVLISTPNNAALQLINARTGSPRWSYTLPVGLAAAEAMRFGDKVVVSINMGMSGTTLVLDAATGSAKWTFPTFASTFDLRQGLFCYAGAVYAACVDAEQGFSVFNMSTALLPAPGVLSLAISDGILMAQVAWNPPTPLGAPSYTNHSGFDLATGMQIYTFTPPTNGLAPATFLVSDNGNIVYPFLAGFNVFSSRTGAFVRRTTKLDGVTGAAIAAKTNTLVIVRENFVYGFDN